MADLAGHGEHDRLPGRRRPARGVRQRRGHDDADGHADRGAAARRPARRRTPPRSPLRTGPGQTGGRHAGVRRRAAPLTTTLDRAVGRRSVTGSGGAVSFPASGCPATTCDGLASAVSGPFPDGVAVLHGSGEGSTPCTPATLGHFGSTASTTCTTTGAAGDAPFGNAIGLATAATACTGPSAHSGRRAVDGRQAGQHYGVGSRRAAPGRLVLPDVHRHQRRRRELGRGRAVRAPRRRTRPSPPACRP